MGVYNIANVGWELVQYTIYEMQKSEIGLGFVSYNISFRHPVNCIMDSLPSNFCLIYNNCDVDFTKDTFLSTVFLS